MNKFIVGACAGILPPATSQYVTVRTAPAKPATKKAPIKRKATKKAESVTAAKPEGVQRKHELGNELHIAGDMTCDQIIKLHWKGKNYDLPCQLTRADADHYFNQKTGFDLVVIPAKAMLFDRNEGHRLADECQTTEMTVGVLTPMQAGALRVPAGPSLMAPDSPALAPAPVPGTA